jgi:hypothetical protein
MGRVEVGKDAYVRLPLVHRRPCALALAHAVAYGVLDAQRREREAAQRRAGGGDVDAQRAARVEQALPVELVRERIKVAFVAISPGRHPPQHAARHARLEVGTACELERPAECDAAFPRIDGVGGQRAQLAREHLLQATRAGGEEIHPDGAAA